MARNPRSWGARVALDNRTVALTLDGAPLVEDSLGGAASGYISFLARKSGLSVAQVLVEIEAAENWLAEHPTANFVCPHLFLLRWMVRRGKAEQRVRIATVKGVLDVGPTE